MELDLKEIQKSLARKRFDRFVSYTKHDYEFNWHHKLLCDKLQDFALGKIKRLMVFMPPRHGKTELASRRLPAWIFGINPNARIISTSYSAELSSSFNRDVQRIIDSKEYAEIFPETYLNSKNVRSDANSKWIRNNDVFEIVNHKGMYRCAGVGGSITGTGGDYLIIDDPIKNYEDAKSGTMRRKVIEWYSSTLYTRQEKDAGIMIIQTRWHEDDLSGYLIDRSKKESEFSDKWDVVSLPALSNGETALDQRKNIDEPLWENKYNYNWLMTTKNTLGSFQFSALYQQNPTPNDGSFVKLSWIKKCEIAPDHFTEIIQSWDMSFGSTSENASFVVGSVYGRIGASVYLLDQVRGQWNFSETIAQFKFMNKKHPKALRKLVERKANGQAVIDSLCLEVPGIIPVDPVGSKESRLASCQPMYEAGNIYYVEASYVDDHIDEIISFPNGKFNDRVDTESQALNYFKDQPHDKFDERYADLKSSGFENKKIEW